MFFCPYFACSTLRKKEENIVVISIPRISYFSLFNKGRRELLGGASGTPAPLDDLPDTAPVDSPEGDQEPSNKAGARFGPCRLATSRLALDLAPADEDISATTVVRGVVKLLCATLRLASAVASSMQAGERPWMARRRPWRI
jgi:hypothetical protein